MTTPEAIHPRTSEQVRNILALANLIELGRYAFDMGDGNADLSCGSAGCVGGHAAVLWPDIRVLTRGANRFSWSQSLLCEKLGLTSPEHDDLCFPDDWHDHDGPKGLSYDEVTGRHAVATLRRLVVFGVVCYCRGDAQEEVYDALATEALEIVRRARQHEDDAR